MVNAYKKLLFDHKLQRCFSEGVQNYQHTFAMTCNRTSLRLYLVVSAPSAGVSNVHKVKNVVQNEECVREMRSFDQGPLPSSLSTKVDTHVIDMIKWTRPSPSIYAIINWTVGRSGNETTSLLYSNVLKVWALNMVYSSPDSLSPPAHNPSLFFPFNSLSLSLSHTHTHTMVFQLTPLFSGLGSVCFQKYPSR